MKDTKQKNTNSKTAATNEKIPEGFVSLSNLTLKKTNEVKKVLIPDILKKTLELPVFKKLDIKPNESVFIYGDIMEIAYQEENANQCSEEKGCFFGGFHLGIRRVNGNLNVYSYRCPCEKRMYELQQFQKNFLYRSYPAPSISVTIADILKEKNIDEDSLNDGSKSVIKTYARLLQYVNRNKKLRTGFLCSSKLKCGKTYETIALCNSFVEMNYSVIYIDNFEFATKFLNLDSQKIIETLNFFKTADILMIDNFCLENKKSLWFYGNILPAILESRNVENKMTGIITNFDLKEIRENLSKIVGIEKSDVQRIMSKLTNLIKNKVLRIN